jgi:hypothetical protein
MGNAGEKVGEGWASSNPGGEGQVQHDDLGAPGILDIGVAEDGLIRSKSDALRQALIALKEKFSTLEAEPSGEGEGYE